MEAKMSILIKGMEMPTSGELLCIVSPNGEVRYKKAVANSWNDSVAIPVPPHGRLIDADVLLGHMKKIHDKWKMEGHYTPTTDDEIMTMNMPTIIEAEEEE